MHIVVIGNGIAGNTAAVTIAEKGRDVKVTVISEEVNPLYSPCVFGKYLSRELKREMLFVQTHTHCRQAGIDTVLGSRVVKIDPDRQMVYVEPESITYDKLILATGSKPVTPPISGCDREGVFTLKTLQDLDRMEAYIEGVKPKKVAIIGSGPIGLEVSVSLRKRGLDVCLVELLNRVAPRLLDEKPSSILKRTLEKNHIQVYLGEEVKHIAGNRRVEAITTDSREFICDLVCLAVGMRPRTELAQEVGIELGPHGGLKVDAGMRTNIKEIYACGDCVEPEDISTGMSDLSLLWHTAKQQGYIAAGNCLGDQKLYLGSLNYTVLEAFGEYVISSGHTTADFAGRNASETEVETSAGYLKIIFTGESIVGLQFIGSEPRHELGALLGLIRKRTTVAELKHLYGSTVFARRLPQWARLISVWH